MFLKVGTLWEPPFVNLICVPPDTKCPKPGMAGFTQDEFGFTLERLYQLSEENVTFSLSGYPVGGAPGPNGTWTGAVGALKDGDIDLIPTTFALKLCQVRQTEQKNIFSFVQTPQDLPWQTF